MTECVGGAGIREEFPVCCRGAFRDHDYAEAIVGHALLDLGEELLLVESYLGEKDDVRRLIQLASCQAARGCDPAGVPTHHLQHENLRRGARHRGDVEPGLTSGDCYEFGDRAEARAAIRM